MYHTRCKSLSLTHTNNLYDYTSLLDVYLLCVMKDQIVMIAIILQTEEYLKTKEDSTAKHILSLIEEFIKWKEKTK